MILAESAQAACHRLLLCHHASPEEVRIACNIHGDVDVENLLCVICLYCGVCVGGRYRIRA